MCLILFAHNAHPRYRFILAANRDEFYARPTAPAEFWTDAPTVLAGKDMERGGTWLGISTNGRFAAVTNYRDPSARAGTKSRGDLTKDFLLGAEKCENFLQKIAVVKSDYSGFNLLAGDFSAEKSELFYLSNRRQTFEKLDAGIYGLSNALIDTNWQKLANGKAKFKEILQNSDEIAPTDLFEIMANRDFAPDEKLPETGIGIERERILSPAFIKTEIYGTRCTTILLIGHNGEVDFLEKTFEDGAAKFVGEFSFRL